MQYIILDLTLYSKGKTYYKGNYWKIVKTRIMDYRFFSSYLKKKLYILKQSQLPSNSYRTKVYLLNIRDY